MRIVAGIARSIVLTTPAGEKVRPTLGRSRQALFNSLGDLSGKKVLDLFAGSGALGLEAASRGANQVAFVEKDRKHVEIIEENVAKVQKSGANFHDQVILGDVASGAFRRVSFVPDIILVDPPYADSAVLFQKAAPALRQWAPNAKIIWELPDFSDSLGLFLQMGDGQWELRRFGGTDFFLSLD